MRYLYTGMAFVLISVLNVLFSQQVVTLDLCYQWAEEHYPLIKQKGLNETFTQIQLDIIEIDKKPKITWNAKASLQSEAIRIDFPLPGIESIELPLYTLQTSLDASYLLWDGGLAEARKATEHASLAAKNQAVEVELYQIKDRVDQYFWGLVLLDIQDSILAKAEETIDTKITTLKGAARQGVVLPSQIKKLQVEKLKLETKRETISGQTKSLVALLSEITGQKITTSAIFELPEWFSEVLTTTLKRPEQALFDSQKQQLLSGYALLDAKKKPKISAFLQAGLGYPNPVNFFEEKVTPFAIGGLRFSWNFLDWGKTEKQKQAIQLQTQLIDNRRATFEFNLKTLKGKYGEEVVALEKQLLIDKEIVKLQEEILKDFSSQLDHGVITATDYSTQLNEGVQARLQFELHQLQIQKLKSEYLTKMGR